MTVIPIRARLLAGIALVLPLVSVANPLLATYQSAAKQDNPAFSSFSVAAGQKFYASEGSKQLSCASCHTSSPKNPGKHAKTNKDIEPLAPSANPKRFTDAVQVEKWFKRNCNDVLGRACTAQEKGDFMTYVLSVK